LQRASEGKTSDLAKGGGGSSKSGFLKEFLRGERKRTAFRVWLGKGRGVLKKRH